MDEMRELLLQELHERYPGNVSSFIHDRFNLECEYLSWDEHSDTDLFLYRAVMEAAEVAGQPVWNCGLGSGSFLFYLLDKGLNPLPPHWECEGCGCIVTDEHADLCFDLPARDCTDCNTKMVRNGIHGSLDEALRSAHFEFRVNEDFLEAATQAALSALKDRMVFQRRWGHKTGPANYRSFYYTDKVNEKDRSLIHVDEASFEYINVEDKQAFSTDFRSITIVAQTGYPMSKHQIPMEEWVERKPDIRSFLRRSIHDMKARGGYYPENKYERTQQLIDLLQPVTWTDLIQIVCYDSGTFTRTGKSTVREIADLIRGSDFQHVLYSRESLQYYLRKEGVPEILDWQMVEQLRRGRRGWEMEIYGEKTPLLEKDQLFQAISYLWPRTNAINWLWNYLNLK